MTGATYLVSDEGGSGHPYVLFHHIPHKTLPGMHCVCTFILEDLLLDAHLNPFRVNTGIPLCDAEHKLKIEQTRKVYKGAQFKFIAATLSVYLSISDKQL